MKLNKIDKSMIVGLFLCVIGLCLYTIFGYDLISKETNEKKKQISHSQSLNEFYSKMIGKRMNKI